MELQLPGDVSVAGVARDAGGVNGGHLNLHLLNAMSAGSVAETGGLGVQHLRFGDESAAVRFVHVQLAGDGWKLVGGRHQ